MQKLRILRLQAGLGPGVLQMPQALSITESALFGRSFSLRKPPSLRASHFCITPFIAESVAASQVPPVKVLELIFMGSNGLISLPLNHHLTSNSSLFSQAWVTWSQESGSRSYPLNLRDQELGTESSPKENEAAGRGVGGVAATTRSKKTGSWEGINNIWPLPPLGPVFLC